MPDLRMSLRVAALFLALTFPVLHAETFTINLGAAIKEGIKNALQPNGNASNVASAGGDAAALVPGRYDGSDRDFERTLTIHPGGKFELEVLQKGNASNLHSGSGRGQLTLKDGQWRYSEDMCTLTVEQAPSALQVQVKTCASAFGDVPFDGRYRLKGKKTADTQTAPAANKNRQLAAQLNCQKLDLSDKGVGDLLGKATRLPQSDVWNHEIAAPAGYTFGGLPIQSVSLAETDGGFLALFVDGDAAAIKAAIKKAHLAGDATVVVMRKVGEANGYPFPGKHAGQPYVQCTTRATASGLY